MRKFFVFIIKKEINYFISFNFMRPARDVIFKPARDARDNIYLNSS